MSTLGRRLYYGHLAPVLAGAVLLLLPASAALAVGLGGLSVDSTLNEPLEATVPVYGVTDEERHTLKVRLAPRTEFQDAGVDRPELLSGLEFSLEQLDGQDVIRITTEQPIPEPYLHFLVEIDWAGGRLLREYTALLDPPLYAEQQARPVTSPVAAPPAPAAVAMPEPAPPPVTRPTAPSVTEAPAAPPPAAPATAARPEQGLLGPPEVRQGRSEVFDTGPAGDEAVMASARGAAGGAIGPTQAGDTLWGIATGLKSRLGVDEFQIMAALVRENPQAFIDGNMNLLKRGEILTVPEPEAVRAISRPQALADYSAQRDAWEQYRQRLAESAPVVAEATRAGGAADAPSVAEPAETPAAAGEPSATQTAGAGQAEQGSDLLRIVQASTQADTQGEQAETGGTSDVPGRSAEGPGEAELTALRAQLATLEEDVVAKESENTELRERLKMLEEQVSQAQRLIRIQEENLALAQRQAEEASKAAAAVPAMAASQPATVTEAKPAAPAEAQPQPAATTAEQKPAQPAAKPAAAKARVVQAPPQKSLMESAMGFLSGWVSTVGLGVAVVLLGVVGLWFIRRRRSIAEFEESILSGSAIDSRPNSADTSDEAPGTDTSFLSDFGVPGMGSMHADEVDPLAEAEVYLAYGRSEQAEDVLKEAITRAPDRAELKLKLLEIYQQRGDVKGFETFAEEMYPAMGEDKDNVWLKIAAMGRKMNPGNPLFRVETGVAASAGAAAGELAIPTPADTLEPFPEPEPDEGLELDLDEFMEEEAPGSGSTGAGIGAAAQRAPGTTLEFDLGEEPDVGAVDEAESPFSAVLDDFDLVDDESAEGISTMETTSELEPAAGREQATAKPGLGGDESEPALELELGETHLSEEDLDLEVPAGESREMFELDESAAGTSQRPQLGDTDRLGIAGLDESEEPGAAAPAADMARTQKLRALDDDALTLGDEPDTGELEWEVGDTGEGADLEFDTGELEAAQPEFVTVTEAGPAARQHAGEAKGGDVEAQVDWDETATKLDLARAYIDMGDEAGARSILDEVLEEGNDAQRRKAQELASQLTASA